MRLVIPLLALAAASKSATITLSTTFDNSLNGTSGATGVVANGFFTYEAPSALANGNYSWSSFVNPTIYIVFSNGSVFTQADFMGPTTNLGVQILSGQFNFTTAPGTKMTTSPGGSADFTNSANNILSLSPNQPNQSYSFGPGGNIYAAYFMDLVYTQGSNIHLYYGGYGIGSSATTISPPAPPAVPEPSTYGMIIGGLALAGAALRRRKVSK